MSRLEVQDGCFLDPVTYAPRASIKVVIANEGLLSRNYYDYSGSLKCWSSDSNKPDPSVPVEARESARCIDCVQNIKGATGYKSKPCKFYTVITVVEEESKTVCSLRIGGVSLFAKAVNKMTLYQYRDYLKSNGEELNTVLTEMYFVETNNLHKMYFKPARPISMEELDAINQLVLKDGEYINPFDNGNENMKDNEYIIKNVLAHYPRINQPYKWSDQQNKSVPCDAMEDGAAYDVGFTMDKAQAKELHSLMSAAWDTRIKDDDSFPQNKLKIAFKKQDDGTFIGKATIKAQYNNKKTGIPKQFDVKNNKLEPDFELTHGSLVNIAVQISPYKQNGGGVSLRLRGAMVKKLAPRMEMSPFDAEEEGFTVGEQSGSPFVTEDSDDAFESETAQSAPSAEPDPFDDDEEEPVKEPVKRKKKKEEPKPEGEDLSSIIDEWGSDED